MHYGSGDYNYQLEDIWAKCPDGSPFLDASGLFVDAQDRVYVLCRGPHPIMVFDPDGNLLASWGEGLFKRPHSIWVDAAGAVYCTDDYAFTLLKFSPEGELLLRLEDFVRPNGISVSTAGELYVSDGEIYKGNGESERVLKMSPDGTSILSWGEGGEAPGQFKFPHSVWVDKRDDVWVGDRENNRIQVFDSQGQFLRELTDVIRPNAVFIDDQGIIYVAEHPQRVSIFSGDGTLLARFGSKGEDMKTALFSTPHSIAVDSRGDIYVGENRHALSEHDGPSRAVQKFRKI